MTNKSSPYRNYINKLKEDGFILHPSSDTIVSKRSFEIKKHEIKKETSNSVVEKPEVKEIISVPSNKNIDKQLTDQKDFPLRTDIIITTIVVLAIFFAFINNFYSRLLKDLILAARSYTYSTRIFSQKNLFRYRGFAFLNIFSLLNVALFFTFSAQIFNISLFSNNFLSIAGIVFVVVVILLYAKIFTYKFLGFIYKTKDTTHYYLSSYLLYIKLVGITLFAINVILPFIPGEISRILINVGAVGFILTSILQLIRGFIILFRNFVPLFYMILYFCCLEILPWLILIKLVQYQISG